MRLIIVRKSCAIAGTRPWTLRFSYDKSSLETWTMAIFPPTGPSTMQHKMTRRAMVKGSLLAGALVPTIGLIGNAAEAAARTPLDPTDPTAKALGFVTDASKVSAATAPTYKAGSKCSTCAQYQ